MKKIIKNIGFFLILPLLVGCAGNTVKREPTPLHKMTQVKVERIGNKWFAIPKQSTANLIGKESREALKIMTSGLLECPVGSAMVMTNYTKEKFRTFYTNYKSILTVSELKSEILPRTDSKEYKELVSVMTAMYRKGTIACFKPLSKTDVKEYKEYMKIQNDPRVVAARINAQAAQQRQISQYIENRKARKERSMESFSNSMAQFNRNMTAKQPVVVDVNVNHSYGNDYTYQVNPGSFR